MALPEASLSLTAARDVNGFVCTGVDLLVRSSSAEDRRKYPSFAADMAIVVLSTGVKFGSKLLPVSLVELTLENGTRTHTHTHTHEVTPINPQGTHWVSGRPEAAPPRPTCFARDPREE